MTGFLALMLHPALHAREALLAIAFVAADWFLYSLMGFGI